MFDFFQSELCPTAFTQASLMLLAAGLLGLLFGYILWGRFKNRITELEDDISSLNGKLRKSKADLVDKQESFDRLDADYAALRTKNRELEYKVRESSKDPISTTAKSTLATTTAAKTVSTAKTGLTSSATTAQDAVVAKKEPVATKTVTTTGKRGRPAGSKNKTTATSTTAVKATTGKRGRPAGSKNKTAKKATVAKKTTGKRGRPAGSKNKTTKKATAVKASAGKRGRPAGSKNKTAKKATTVKATTGKRGRPAGSKNKTTKKTTVAKTTTGKRGRPAGSKNKTTGKRGRPAGSNNKTKSLKTSFSAASLTAAKTVFGKKVEANDLALIEGIGPATSKLFSKNGIKSWSALASKTPDDLRKILQKGGNRYQLLEPKTWPRQAKMAASAEWKKLKVYQDKLDGGK